MWHIIVIDATISESERHRISKYALYLYPLHNTRHNKNTSKLKHIIKAITSSLDWTFNIFF